MYLDRSEAVFPRLVEYLEGDLGDVYGQIWLVDDRLERDLLLLVHEWGSTRGISPTHFTLEPGEGLVGTSWQAGVVQAYTMPDSLAQTAAPAFVSSEGLLRFVVLPFFGEKPGVLLLGSKDKDFDLNAAQGTTFAELAALAARRTSDLWRERYGQFVKPTLRAGRELTSNTEFLGRGLELIFRQLSASFGFILLWNLERTALEVAAIRPEVDGPKKIDATAFLTRLGDAPHEYRLFCAEDESFIDNSDWIGSSHIKVDEVVELLSQFGIHTRPDQLRMVFAPLDTDIGTDGTSSGIICLLRPLGAPAFHPDDGSLLMAMSGALALVLDRSRSIRRKVDMLEAASDLISQPWLDEITAVAIDRLQVLTNTNRVLIALMDKSTPSGWTVHSDPDHQVDVESVAFLSEPVRSSESLQALVESWHPNTSVVSGWDPGRNDVEIVVPVLRFGDFIGFVLVMFNDKQVDAGELRLYLHLIADHVALASNELSLMTQVEELTDRLQQLRRVEASQRIVPLVRELVEERTLRAAISIEQMIRELACGLPDLKIDALRSESILELRELRHVTNWFAQVSSEVPPGVLPRIEDNYVGDVVDGCTAFVETEFVSDGIKVSSHRETFDEKIPVGNGGVLVQILTTLLRIGCSRAEAEVSFEAQSIPAPRDVVALKVTVAWDRRADDHEDHEIDLEDERRLIGAVGAELVTALVVGEEQRSGRRWITCNISIIDGI